MRVDGRDITVSGSLLQPLTRRTNDILRLVLATVFLAIVIAGSLITRGDGSRSRNPSPKSSAFCHPPRPT